MFIKFFQALRAAGVLVSLHEYLDLMLVIKKGNRPLGMEAFYGLSKAVFIKNENQLYRFNKVFSDTFSALSDISFEDLFGSIPKEWLQTLFQREISAAEKAELEKLGGLDALMERLKELMAEQDEAHNGGNKWIGTGGTSPFGHGGYHPEGFRIGGKSAGHRTAIKTLGGRSFQDLDDQSEVNTRNIKIALKYLRNFVREGQQNEFDLDGTIRQTSENAGMLSIAMRAPRKNKLKVLLLMDIGGSMDDHVYTCEKLFTSMRHEFKQLENFYFHNCVYESLWKNNARRHQERMSTLELIRKYNSDYHLIFVGDAAMSPYEIFYRGGSVEYFNEEPGIQWLRLLRDNYPSMIWLNPNPAHEWAFYESTSIIREFTQQRMFPLTLEGLRLGMNCLKHPNKKFTNVSWK